MSLQVWLPLNGSLENQGLSNIIVTNNGATVSNGGKIGKCYSFNGSNNYLSIDPVITNGNQNFSFCCWVKLNALPASGAYYCLLCSRTSTANTCVGIWLKGDKTFTIDVGGRWTTAVQNIVADTWYHIAVTSTNAKRVLYINGIQTTSTTSINTNISTANTNNVLIGAQMSAANGAANGTYINGYLNDVRIYDHCLSDKEVEEISKGLLLHYKLDSNFDGTINPNLLPDTNVSSLTKVVAAYNRYYESSSSGTYTKAFESISNPPVLGILYGVHYNVTSASGFHGVCWYNGGLVSVETGQQYTLSCYAKKYTTGTTITLKFQYGKNPYISGTVNMIDDTNWHQYKWTFTPETGSGKAAASGTTRIYGAGPSTVGEVIICGWKLEKGSVATQWCEYDSSITGLTVYDSSGYNNNATLSNAFTTFSTDSGRYSQSALFGTYKLPQAVLNNLTILSILQHCTITWWEKCTGTGNALRFNGQSDYQYIAAGSSSTRLYDMNIGDSIILYKDGVAESAQTSATGDNGITIYHGNIFHTQNEWHFFAYVDVNLTSWTTFRLNAYGSSWPENAYLSDVRIYNTVLTESQIKELYNTSSTIDNLGNVYAREVIEE